MKIGEKKMSVEEYVAFFASGNSTDFTISYLNQIIHMHGFRKLHKAQKKIVGEAVDALDLIDLCRSTLKQTPVTSSSSPLTLDEIIDDIEALKWQECCITSLQTINTNEIITQSDPKPNQKSNKRKKATAKKSMNANLGNENDGDTMISIPTLPKKIRTKKTKNNTKRNHISE